MNRTLIVCAGHHGGDHIGCRCTDHSQRRPDRPNGREHAAAQLDGGPTPRTRATRRGRSTTGNPWVLSPNGGTFVRGGSSDFGVNEGHRAGRSRVRARTGLHTRVLRHQPRIPESVDRLGRGGRLLAFLRRRIGDRGFGHTQQAGAPRRTTSRTFGTLNFVARRRALSLRCNRSGRARARPRTWASTGSM